MYAHPVTTDEHQKKYKHRCLAESHLLFFLADKDGGSCLNSQNGNYFSS